MKIIVTFLEEPLPQENVSETTSLQKAFSELRTVCAEEQCELVIPTHFNTRWVDKNKPTVFGKLFNGRNTVF